MINCLSNAMSVSICKSGRSNGPVGDAVVVMTRVPAGGNALFAGCGVLVVVDGESGFVLYVLIGVMHGMHRLAIV